MPVTKKKTKKPAPKPMPMMPQQPLVNVFQTSDFARKILWTLFGILLGYLIVLFGTVIRNNLETFEYIGQADRQERTITINGTGTVTAKPDIAVVTMGTVSEGESVADAQTQNNLVMDGLVRGLAELGVEKEDIQTTSYNIYPQYDFTEEEGRQLRGYEVRQNVTIKIRDLERANQVLALAGTVGANSVSGLQFTIDDTDVYLNEARENALDKVAAKASALSRSLGVQLVAIASYDEWEGGLDVYGYEKSYAFEELSFGGSVPVESGSTDIVLNVSVAFEIR